MNPFASRRTKTLPIPFDPDHSVTLRGLSGRQLAKAQEANQFSSYERLRRLGGARFQKELVALGSEEERAAQIARLKADPLNGYDPYLLCYRGIESWTYPEPLTPVMIVDESSEETLAAIKAVVESVTRQGNLVLAVEAAAAILEAAKHVRSAIPAIDDLDDEAIDWFAREILRLSKPSLFQTPAEVGAARGEDSGASIAP